MTNRNLIEQRIKQHIDPLHRPEVILIPVKLDNTFPKAIFDKRWHTWCEVPTMTLAEAKERTPMTFDYRVDDRQPGLDEFYKVIDNPEITSPWRKKVECHHFLSTAI